MKHVQRKLKAVVATLCVALVMCFIALIGMSFAWFVQSDSFTSSISVGSVMLEVTGFGGDEAVLSFENAQPGGLYAGYFSVESDGGFAFSCSLSVEIEEDLNGLADELKVYVISLEEEGDEVSYDDVTEERCVGTLADLDGKSHTFMEGVATGRTEYFAVVIVFDTAATNDSENTSVTFQMTITATQVGEKE